MEAGTPRRGWALGPGGAQGPGWGSVRVGSVCSSLQPQRWESMRRAAPSAYFVVLIALGCLLSPQGSAVSRRKTYRGPSVSRTRRTPLLGYLEDQHISATQCDDIAPFPQEAISVVHSGVGYVLVGSPCSREQELLPAPIEVMRKVCRFSSAFSMSEMSRGDQRTPVIACLSSCCSQWALDHCYRSKTTLTQKSFTCFSRVSYMLTVS